MPPPPASHKEIWLSKPISTRTSVQPVRPGSIGQRTHGCCKVVGKPVIFLVNNGKELSAFKSLLCQKVTIPWATGTLASYPLSQAQTCSLGRHLTKYKFLSLNQSASLLSNLTLKRWSQSWNSGKFSSQRYDPRLASRYGHQLHYLTATPSAVRRHGKHEHSVTHQPERLLITLGNISVPSITQLVISSTKV